MKKLIRTAVAVAAVVTALPAVAGESAPPSARNEKATVAERDTVEALQKRVAILEQAVDNLTKSAVERDIRQARIQVEDDNLFSP